MDRRVVGRPSATSAWATAYPSIAELSKPGSATDGAHVLGRREPEGLHQRLVEGRERVDRGEDPVAVLLDGDELVSHAPRRYPAATRSAAAVSSVDVADDLHLRPRRSSRRSTFSDVASRSDGAPSGKRCSKSATSL